MGSEAQYIHSRNSTLALNCAAAPNFLANLAAHQMYAGRSIFLERRFAAGKVGRYYYRSLSDSDLFQQMKSEKTYKLVLAAVTVEVLL